MFDIIWFKILYSLKDEDVILIFNWYDNNIRAPHVCKLYRSVCTDQNKTLENLSRPITTYHSYHLTFESVL